jgi:hypothetical protein
MKQALQLFSIVNIPLFFVAIGSAVAVFVKGWNYDRAKTKDEPQKHFEVPETPLWNSNGEEHFDPEAHYVSKD